MPTTGSSTGTVVVMRNRRSVLPGRPSMRICTDSGDSGWSPIDTSALTHEASMRSSGSSRSITAKFNG